KVLPEKVKESVFLTLFELQVHVLQELGDEFFHVSPLCFSYRIKDRECLVETTDELTEVRSHYVERSRKRPKSTVSDRDIKSITSGIVFDLNIFGIDTAEGSIDVTS